jgi:hypothetical protein
MRSHVAIGKCAPETVEDRLICGRAAPKPVAEPGLLEEIWRSAHALHPPGNRDFGIAGDDLGCRQHDRLEPGPADAIDGGCGIAEGGTCFESSLTGRGLPGARL